MFKKKGLGKRIAGAILAVTMVVTLIPQMDFCASSVKVEGQPVYNDVVFNAIKDKITNSSNTTKDTVYGGLGSWFYFDEKNRVGMTHVYHNTAYYISSVVNLRPSVEVISADDNSYKAVFKSRIQKTTGEWLAAPLGNIISNPDVSLKFGATFKSTNSKPSMTLNGVTIGGNDLSKKKTQSKEGTASYPFPEAAEDLEIVVQGASGTSVKNMWVAAIDNTAAEYNNVTAELTSNGLLLHVQMDEELRWANDTAGQYADDMYIHIKLLNSLTGIESDELKADFYELKGDTITFCCSKEVLGEFYDSEFQVTRISKANIPVIQDIDFEVYGIRGCHDYQSGYDSSTRTTKYTKVGNSITYIQDVKLTTTPITDLAGNKVDLGSVNLLGKNLCFDNVNPEIKKITITDSSGKNRDDAAKANGSEDTWPEDINREEIFLGTGQGLNFSVAYSELMDISGTVTAKLNVLDKNGKQVVLQKKAITQASAGVYSEKPSTILQFETFVAAEGMTMMSGYEGKSIQIVSLTGTYVDKAGNSLTGTTPSADKQIFLDATAPNVTIEKLETTANGRDLEFLVTIDDKGDSTSLVAGILGEYATLSLSPKELEDYTDSYKYTYKVLTTDNKELNSGSGTMSANKAGVIRWKLHGVNSYTTKVQVTFTNSNQITMDGIQTSLSVEDIVGNGTTNASQELAIQIDEVAPEVTVYPVEYSYTSTTASTDIRFTAKDYSKVASVQYQKTDVDATAPVDGEWTAIEITEGNNIDKTLSETGISDSTSYKLWILVGDERGNTSLVSTKVVVDINKPNISYDASTITTEPDDAPVLTVIGPTKEKDNSTTGYTRVTLTMGDNVYVRIVKTGETVNVFDFSSSVTWYKVVFNEAKDAYTSVTTLTDNSVLKNYYGEVYVSFDAAYADLTPQVGAITASVTNGTYIKDDAQIKVLYASTSAKTSPNEVHQVIFGTIKDATGQTVLTEDATEGKSAVELNQVAGETSVMAGVQVNFTLSNLLIQEWSISNIDFSKSYVTLSYGEGDTATVLDTALLQNTENQTYILPEALEYETGMYYITVYVYQNGADTPAQYRSLNIVLDANEVENHGLWKYTIYPFTDWSEMQLAYTAETEPFETLGVCVTATEGYSEQKEMTELQDDVFKYYTAGATALGITLQCAENIETYDGVTTGEVVGFRFWNSLSNLSEEDLANYEFTRTNEAGTGTAEYVYSRLWMILCDKDDFPQGSDGYISNSASKLYLVSGVNTFYYQVKLANGTISEIKQFTIYVTDIAPTLSVSVADMEYCVKRSDIESQIAVSNITMEVGEAFSMNGSGDTIVSLLSLRDANITHADQTTAVYTSELYYDKAGELQVGDLVTFDNDGHNSQSGSKFECGGDGATVGFIVYDEYGGAMLVAPQIGGETHKYAIDATAWGIKPFNFSSSLNKGAFVESYLSIRDDDIYKKDFLPELVDYDSITFTFFHEEIGENGEKKEVDYLTVPMVANYAEPNEAGYMGAVRDADTGEFTVYFANPVDEKPIYSWISYKVNYKDIYGNDHVISAGYAPHQVSSGVRTENSTDTGVNILLYAAVAGGIDAQYRNYDGSVCSGLIETGLFATGDTYAGTYTDMFGKTHSIEYTIQYGWDIGVDVTYSTQEPTFDDVIVTLKSKDANVPITVAEQEGLTIESNGTTAVKLTATQNMTIDFTLKGSESVYHVEVDNIAEFHPTIQWSYDESQILTDDNGVQYMNGSVTAYLIDEELDVFDRYTGKEPSYTFYPGEETSYTFKGEDYYAVIGEAQMSGADLEVTLPIELRNETFEVENTEVDTTTDTNAPAVQLRAYAQRNGIYSDEKLSLQVEPGAYGMTLTDYTDSTIIECFEDRADTTEFLEEIGWAAAYRFQIELADDSDVKLFVKKGLYATAPNYTIGGSDSITGVNLNGRIVEITDNVEFTLFAVDEMGNATAIPLNITNVGEAPAPQVKTVYAGTNAYVYVLPPAVDEGLVADFKLTGPTGVQVETEEGNEYYGQWYMAYGKNGTYTLTYSYTYKNEPVIGNLEVVVDEIDDVQILSKDIKWSANKSKLSTNQDVTVQLTFNKSVKEIYVPYGYEDKVDVLITGNRVTVRYEENLNEKLPITAVAFNDTNITLELDAVTNIDKVAPVVNEPEIQLADNGKSVTVTFITDEDALFREGNRYGTKTDAGYVHKMTIKENGEYTYIFMDKAGNMTEATFTVDTIVDTPLKLWFNTTASNTGAVEDPSGYTLRVGDSIYVKANRASEISLNNATAKEVAANTWQEFVITENEAGLWPIFFAVDAYGNTTAALLGGVKPVDKDAPVIMLAKECISVKVGTDRATILEALKANITVNDADADVTVTIDFTDNLNVEGTTVVTYTAIDGSGNKAIKSGYLRLTAANEPKVTVDGEVVDRDTIYLGSLEDALNLNVDTYGEPYSVVYKESVCTAAQMKIGATTLVRDVEEVTDIALPLETSGYYTICIRTQSHDEYLFIVYVD